MTDFLSPLIDAYRAENRGAALDTSALRTRILSTSARRKRTPRAVTWLVPIAAAFVASASLAAIPSARAPLAHALTQISLLITTVTHAPPSHRPQSPLRSPVPARIPAPAPVTPALSPSPDLPAPAPAPAPTVLAAPTPTPHSLPPIPFTSASVSDPPLPPSPSPASTSTSTSAPAPASAPPSHSPPVSPNLSPDLQSYSAAHHLHFVDADFPRALLAWNAYLDRFPAGTFAPEARLNRAVCLAHLGRTSEARQTLTAIASGKLGPDGRIEAQRLLKALGSAP